jgi:hypothetical protein
MKKINNSKYVIIFIISIVALLAISVLTDYVKSYDNLIDRLIFNGGNHAELSFTHDNDARSNHRPGIIAKHYLIFQGRSNIAAILYEIVDNDRIYSVVSIEYCRISSLRTARHKAGNNTEIQDFGLLLASPLK